MRKVRQTLAIKVATPGGDNPLLMSLVAANAPYYRGVAVSGLALVGRGGTAPYSFVKLTGTIPTGLTLHTDGTFTGTPTTSGRFTFVAEVTDSDSNTFAHAFSIDILAQLFRVGPPPVDGEIGLAYSYQFVVRDGSGTTLTSGYSITSGSLPPGLSMNAAGLITGTPTVPDGISYATLTVTDGTDTLTYSFTITIYTFLSLDFEETRDPPEGWGGGAGSWLPSMIRGQLWQAHILVSGGRPPYSFSESAVDPFPSGINIVTNNRRLLSGKTMDAAAPNPYLLGLGVTDSLGSFLLVQRAFFIVDSQQGRVTHKHNAVIAGPDGALNYNFTDTASLTWSLTSDGNVLSISAAATGGAGSGIDSINGAGPDSGGNISLVSHDNSVNIHQNTHGDIDLSVTAGTASPLTTKGDLWGYGTTNMRVPVGTNDLPLVGDSAATAGVSYKILPVAGGGTSFASYTQGDILYASASGTLTKLAKNTTATRYLSNTGTSNNPAWAQVDLTNGVSGALPIANGGTNATTAPNALTNLGAQAAIQIKDEGSNQGAAGAATNYDFVGAGVTAAVSGATATITIAGGSSTIQAAAVTGGTGEDGNCDLDGVNTFPWCTLAGSVYTQTRNCAVARLRISTGVTLLPAAFHVWIQQWVCTTGFYGKLDGVASGNGNNATGATAGVAGTRAWATTRYFAVSPIAPTNGGSGPVGAGTSSTSTTTNSNSFGGSGTRGALGGNGTSGAGAQGGTCGAFSGYFPISNPYAFLFQIDNSNVLTGGGPGTGGGTGAGDGANTAGGGGGGGAGGPGMDLSIGEIVTDGSTPARMVDCRGGAGGNGGNRTVGNVGGGGGGGAGGGGYIRCLLGFHTGATVVGFFDCSGGKGGDGGTKAGTGTNGAGAIGGDSGRIAFINAVTGVATFGAQATGSAASGVTGGAGGVCTVTLT